VNARISSVLIRILIWPRGTADRCRVGGDKRPDTTIGEGQRVDHAVRGVTGTDVREERKGIKPVQDRGTHHWGNSVDNRTSLGSSRHWTSRLGGEANTRRMA
jgi:hypothetical protein